MGNTGKVKNVTNILEYSRIRTSTRAWRTVQTVVDCTQSTIVSEFGLAINEPSLMVHQIIPLTSLAGLYLISFNLYLILEVTIRYHFSQKTRFVVQNLYPPTCNIIHFIPFESNDMQSYNRYTVLY